MLCELRELRVRFPLRPPAAPQPPRAGTRTARPSRALRQFQHRGTETQRHREIAPRALRTPRTPREISSAPSRRAAASACRSARHSSGTILAKGLSPETDAAPCVPGTPPPQGVIGGGWETRSLTTSDADEVPRSGFNSQLIASGHENPHRYVSKGAENCMGQPGSSVSNLLSFQYRPHPNHSHFSSASFFALRCRCRFQRP